MSVVAGAGLGLRRALLGSLAGLAATDPDRAVTSVSAAMSSMASGEASAADAPVILPDFFEVAPENWIGVGGRLGRQFRAMTERFPFVTHGLSLSLGSTDPLDLNLVRSVARFLQTHGIDTYSEHLSYCSDSGHLYDLMPIPYTAQAVSHVAQRIRTVQEELGRRIAIENVSCYATPHAEMSELQFLTAVLAEADCDLLLDVNNVYVNSINHCYDAETFIAGIPGERIRFIHIAGHYDEAPDLKVDTHGADVIDPVWQLLRSAYQRFGVKPTLLERDFNLPPLPRLLAEVDRIRQIQREHVPAGITQMQAGTEVVAQARQARV